MTGARQITGRTVLTGMIVFFGVIFAVNGAFVYFALNSWPGLDVENAYRRGIEYNKVLSAANIQASLGWRSRLKVQRMEGSGNQIVVAMQTEAGKPIPELQLTLRLRRPTHEGHDQVAFLKQSAPGIYTGQMQIPMPGMWQAVVRARSAIGETYVMAHDLLIAE